MNFGDLLPYLSHDVTTRKLFSFHGYDLWLSVRLTDLRERGDLVWVQHRVSHSISIHTTPPPPSPYHSQLEMDSFSNI
jgi:hypothetical protein